MAKRNQILVLSLVVSSNGMIMKNIKENLNSNSIFNQDFQDYYDYDYEEPLPQGPTRPPARKKPVEYPEEDYYYYEDELPQGPTKEPPLPSGPTRRPGQPTTLHPSKQSTTVNPALSQFLSLPLLTTQRPPRKLRLPAEEKPLDILEEFGGFEEHFIAPPQLNAGALPLAVNDNLPLFPPFNKPRKVEEASEESQG